MQASEIRQARLSVISDWLGVRSLALVTPGDVIQVDEIALDMTRSRYWEAGLKEGAVARCDASDEDSVTLRLLSGETVSVDRDHAWFISVKAD